MRRRRPWWAAAWVLAGSAALLAAPASEEHRMKTQVHRDGDRVWIEGVKGWFCGDKESSVHAAQEAVMQALGENASYDSLLGISGLAFRMQVSKEGLCPGSTSAWPSIGPRRRAI